MTRDPPYETFVLDGAREHGLPPAWIAGSLRAGTPTAAGADAW